ncbi:MAG: NAD(P)H-dependent glycerol-3-phosphate dehydrogenase [Negativicutes bacterium]|nr:NAD(P)H-dependent glycerol-3-phosphate dehydrogenase [Negativicutes bacterium]
MKVTVLGAGSWGTVMARMLGQKHKAVTLWVRSPELKEKIALRRENSDYLPNVILPETVSFTSDIREAAAQAKYIVIATPSHAVRQTVRQIADVVEPDTIIVSAAKGLETDSLKRMSEVIASEIPLQAGNIAVLSGPNHAEEVGVQYPTTSVVAAVSREVAEAVQDLFLLPYFRVYTNPDIAGVELGGALKNIIALGAGVAEGLGFGDNSKAALMTRGLAEISRLGVAMNATPATFAGLSGLGDLIVTCTSRHSRNRRAGLLLAQGKSLVQVEAETKMVVEGIRATLAAYRLARLHGVEMPITEQIYLILYEGKSPHDAVFDLMMRSRTHEAEEVVINNYWNNW